MTNAVQQAPSQLPNEMQKEGLIVCKPSSSVPASQVIYSPDNSLTPLQISNYLRINLLDWLARVHGISQAFVFGGQNYAMRIIYNTDRLSELWLAPSELLPLIG